MASPSTQRIKTGSSIDAVTMRKICAVYLLCIEIRGLVESKSRREVIDDVIAKDGKTLQKTLAAEPILLSQAMRESSAIAQSFWKFNYVDQKNVHLCNLLKSDLRSSITDITEYEKYLNDAANLDLRTSKGLVNRLILFAQDHDPVLRALAPIVKHSASIGISPSSASVSAVATEYASPSAAAAVVAADSELFDQTTIISKKSKLVLPQLYEEEEVDWSPAKEEHAEGHAEVHGKETEELSRTEGHVADDATIAQLFTRLLSHLKLSDILADKVLRASDTSDVLPGPRADVLNARAVFLSMQRDLHHCLRGENRYIHSNECIDMVGNFVLAAQRLDVSVQALQLMRRDNELTRALGDRVVFSHSTDTATTTLPPLPPIAVHETFRTSSEIYRDFTDAAAFTA